MQYFSKDEYAQQLPRCAGCLQDFDLYQYPCQFLCRHIYCTLCLKRLKEDSETYKCLYDGCLTPVLSAKSDIGFYNRIDYFKRFVLTRTEMSADLITQLDQIKKEVNYKLVACRDTLDTSQCALSSRCPYDHSLKSLNIARKFRDSDAESCWECKNCMLTVARRLQLCPVCESSQNAPTTPKIVYSPLVRGYNREARNVTNATLDLSVVADEEKPKPPLIKQEDEDLSSIHEKKEPTPPEVKQENVERPSNHENNAQETPSAPVESSNKPQSDEKPAVVKSSTCCVLQ